MPNSAARAFRRYNADAASQDPSRSTFQSERESSSQSRSSQLMAHDDPARRPSTQSLHLDLDGLDLGARYVAPPLPYARGGSSGKKKDKESASVRSKRAQHIPESSPIRRLSIDRRWRGPATAGAASIAQPSYFYPLEANTGATSSGSGGSFQLSSFPTPPESSTEAANYSPANTHSSGAISQSVSPASFMTDPFFASSSIASSSHAPSAFTDMTGTSIPRSTGAAFVAASSGMDSFMAHLRADCDDAREIEDADTALAQSDRERAVEGVVGHAELRGALPSSTSRLDPNSGTTASGQTHHSQQILGGFASLGYDPTRPGMPRFATTNSIPALTAAEMRPATPSQMLEPPNHLLRLGSAAQASMRASDAPQHPRQLIGFECADDGLAWGRLKVVPRDPMELFDIMSIEELGQHSIDVGSAAEWEGFTLLTETAGVDPGPVSWSVARSMSRSRKWLVAPALALEDHDNASADALCASCNESKCSYIARAVVVSDRASWHTGTEQQVSSAFSSASLELRFLRAGHGAPDSTILLASPQVHRTTATSDFSQAPRSRNIRGNNGSTSSPSGLSVQQSTKGPYKFEPVDRTKLRRTRSRPALNSQRHLIGNGNQQSGGSGSKTDDFAPSLPGEAKGRGWEPDVAWPSARPKRADSVELTEAPALRFDANSSRLATRNDNLRATSSSPVGIPGVTATSLRTKRTSLPSLHAGESPPHLLQPLDGGSAEGPAASLLFPAGFGMHTNSIADELRISAPSDDGEDGEEDPLGYNIASSKSSDDGRIDAVVDVRETSWFDERRMGGDPGSRSSIATMSVDHDRPGSSMTHFSDGSGMDRLTAAGATPSNGGTSYVNSPLASTPSTSTFTNGTEIRATNPHLAALSGSVKKDTKRLSDWFKKKVGSPSTTFSTGGPTTSALTNVRVISKPSGGPPWVQTGSSSPLKMSPKMKQLMELEPYDDRRGLNTSSDPPLDLDALHSSLGSVPRHEQRARGRFDSAPESPASALRNMQDAQEDSLQALGVGPAVNVVDSRRGSAGLRKSGSDDELATDLGYEARRRAVLGDLAVAKENEIAVAASAKARARAHTSPRRQVGLPVREVRLRANTTSGVKNEGGAASTDKAATLEVHRDDVQRQSLSGEANAELVAPTLATHRSSVSSSGRASARASSLLSRQHRGSAPSVDDRDPAFHLEKGQQYVNQHVLGLDSVAAGALTMILPLPLFLSNPDSPVTDGSDSKEMRHSTPQRWLRISFVPFDDGPTFQGGTQEGQSFLDESRAHTSQGEVSSTLGPGPATELYQPGAASSSSGSAVVGEKSSGGGDGDSNHSSAWYRKFAGALSSSTKDGATQGEAHGHGHGLHLHWHLHPHGHSHQHQHHTHNHNHSHSHQQEPMQSTKAVELTYDRCRMPSRRRVAKTFRITALVLPGEWHSDESDNESDYFDTTVRARTRETDSTTEQEPAEPGSAGSSGFASSIGTTAATSASAHAHSQHVANAAALLPAEIQHQHKLQLLPEPSAFPIVLGLCDATRGLELLPDGWAALGLCTGPAELIVASGTPSAEKEETSQGTKEQSPLVGVADLVVAACAAVMDF